MHTSYRTFASYAGLTTTSLHIQLCCAGLLRSKVSYAVASCMPLLCTTRQICSITTGNYRSCGSGLTPSPTQVFRNFSAVSICTVGLLTSVELPHIVVSTVRTTSRQMTRRYRQQHAVNLSVPPQRQTSGGGRPQTALRARQRPQRRPRQSESIEPDAEPVTRESDGFSAAFDLESPVRYVH